MKRRLEVLSFLSVEGARPHTRARLFLDDINRGVEGPETIQLLKLQCTISQLSVAQPFIGRC